MDLVVEETYESPLHASCRRIRRGMRPCHRRGHILCQPRDPERVVLDARTRCKVSRPPRQMRWGHRDVGKLPRPADMQLADESAAVPEHHFGKSERLTFFYVGKDPGGPGRRATCALSELNECGRRRALGQAAGCCSTGSTRRVLRTQLLSRRVAPRPPSRRTEGLVFTIRQLCRR